MDNSWTREQEATEKGNIIADFECAEAKGYTKEEAEVCNAGDLNCEGCPFRGGK